MPRLNTTVHVYDGEDVIVYLPGQEVLPQHREQITAPDVWAEDPEPEDTDTLIFNALLASGIDSGVIPDVIESLKALAAGESFEEGDEDDEDDEEEDGSKGEKSEEQSEDKGTPALTPPPAKAGPGASTEAWAEYAATATAERELKIEIPADAGRDDIIDALNAAGIPTE